MKTFQQFQNDIDCLSEGRIPWRSTKNPNPSGWMPSEKAELKREQLKAEIRKDPNNERLQKRHRGLMNVLANPPVRRTEPIHVSNMERFFKVNIGKSRRDVEGGRLLPKPKALPGNSRRRKFYMNKIKGEK